MKKSFKGLIKEFFSSNKEQKNNQKILLKEFSLIVGAIFLSEGIIALFPSSMDKTFLGGIGMMLIILTLLSTKRFKTGSN